MLLVEWPEAAFHFALKGRGGWEGGRGRAAEVLSPGDHPPLPALELSFAGGEGRERAGETTATVPPNAAAVPNQGVNSSRK